MFGGHLSLEFRGLVAVCRDNFLSFFCNARETDRHHIRAHVMGTQSKAVLAGMATFLFMVVGTVQMCM